MKKVMMISMFLTLILNAENNPSVKNNNFDLRSKSPILCFNNTHYDKKERMCVLNK